MIAWLGSGASPLSLLIQAGRDRENVLLSVSPTSRQKNPSRQREDCQEGTSLRSFLREETP